MIGQTIGSRPRPPLGVAIWLLLAVALDVLAVVVANVHVAIASLLPWLAALFLWLARERPFTARFTETALEMDEPPLTVAYADMQGLLAPRRPANPFKAGPRSYPIQVIHHGGVLLLPRRLNVPSDDVFSFLFRQFSPSGGRQVPAALADFLRHRERAFGPERVWTYQARTYSGHNERHPRLAAFFLALSVAAVIWIVWGVSQNMEGWIACGVSLLVLGLLFTLLIWLAGRQNAGGIRRRKQSGLIIAPDGLALAQGDMLGELRWDEVRDVRFGKGVASFQLTTSSQPLRGIVLKVEGADIVIADIYDRPIGLIYQNICHYWRGKTLDDDWEQERDALAMQSKKVVRRTVPKATGSPPADGIMPPE